MDLLNNKLQHRTQWDAQQVTGSDVRVLRRACFGYETMTSTSCLPSGYRAPPADRRPAEHCGQRSQEGRGRSGAGHQPPDGALQPQAALSQFWVRPPRDVRARAVANRGARRGGRGGEERDGQRSALHRRGGQHTEGPRHPTVTQVCHARPSPSHDKVGKPPSSQLTRVCFRRLMPAILHALQNRKELLTNEIYLLSAVTALQRVTETLPHFISPYLHDATLQVTPPREHCIRKKNKGYKGLRWSCALIGSCCALFLALRFFFI